MSAALVISKDEVDAFWLLECTR